MRIVFDLEVYSNYFLAMFVFEDGEVATFEMRGSFVYGDLHEIAREIQKHTLISFNGRRYDMPLLSMAINGENTTTIKEASDLIIKENQMWWHLEQKYNFMTLDIDHIDIINLLPLYESLKLYGARNGTNKLQDLPYLEDTTITDAMAKELRTYCRNDCHLTWELFVKLWPVIELRVSMGEMYNQDLRSKSDAQIAEAVMISEYQNITGTRLIKPIDAGHLPTEVMYKAPEWVKFDDQDLNQLKLRIQYEPFQLSPANGKPLSPDWLKGKTVTIGDKPYAVGLGGLHAKNKSESYYSGSRGQLIDLDVTSYYPRIILNNGYQPPHMGEIFTRIYSSLVDQRLDAKASGNKTAAEALKITINGTYGKLGSRYSAVYAPELLLGVTFSGQLALLMLIEKMAQNGIQCVSANTDGVTLMITNENKCVLYTIINQWEADTGFELDETKYKSIHYRDVNNYFALTVEGELKTKGIFKSPALDKNPAAPIVTSAAMGYILYGQSMETCIESCCDMHEFVSARKVAGGAAKDSEYLGKAVRWYYSTETDTAIHYISNGNMVAKSMGGMPMMEMTNELPDDLDYEWYLAEAKKTVDDVGYYGWL